MFSGYLFKPYLIHSHPTNPLHGRLQPLHHGCLIRPLHHLHPQRQMIARSIRPGDNRLRRPHAGHLGGGEAQLVGVEEHAAHLDRFAAPAERLGWLAQRRAAAEAFMADYAGLLSNAGIAPDRVSAIVKERDCPSLSQCIMEEMQRLDASTIALGRTGLQAREELLLGSVSKRIVHHAKNCAVWVVT